MSIGEHSRMLPGLKLSNPYNKLWSIGQEETAVPVFVPPTSDRPPSVQPPESHSPSHESCVPGLEPMELSNPGNITIPRPHGRKTPELGSVLAPPVAQSRSKPAGPGEGRTTTGGQEFRQALSMTTDGDLLKATEVTEDSVDLLSLLDPLNSSGQTTSTSLNDKVDIGMSSSSCKPSLAHRPYPQGFPSFPVPPQMSLNPFAQPLQNTSPQMRYSPTVSGNPFVVVYGPPSGSFLHAPPPPQSSISTLPGLYRQQSPGSSTMLQSTLPCSLTPLPTSSASSHAISSLSDSTIVPSAAVSTSVKPLHANTAGQKTQDPFGDLLTMVNPATPQKKKAEDLRRRWETFD